VPVWVKISPRGEGIRLPRSKLRGIIRIEDLKSEENAALWRAIDEGKTEEKKPEMD
jgi:hypothetical protein